MPDQDRAFWDRATRAAYLAKTAVRAAAARRRTDGVATAAALEGLWARLEDRERTLIQALLAAGRRSFVAPHDDPALRHLVALNLLAYPRGQGGAWMRAAKTTYSIPPAVWQRLQQRPANAKPGRLEPSAGYLSL